MVNINSLLFKSRMAIHLETALDVIQKNKLKLMLDGGSFVFFFLFNNEVYGGDEMSRVTFARMKNPDKEDGAGWSKEANFVGTSINKLGQNQQQQMIFTDKDLSKIEIISKEEAFSQLERFFEKEKESKPNQ